jgi:hypothetical protein
LTKAARDSALAANDLISYILASLETPVFSGR